MIGRITKHWYCKNQRVNGMSGGCIDCYKEKNLKVEESEEQLIFDCVTTKRYRKWFWKHVSEDDASMCFSREHHSRLEALMATKNKETWALLGEYIYIYIQDLVQTTSSVAETLIKIMMGKEGGLQEGPSRP